MKKFAGASPEYVEFLFKQWQEYPNSVSSEWAAFFNGFELGQSSISEPGKEFDANLAYKNASVESLIYRYRDNGHLLACTDPLSGCRTNHPLLELKAFDLDKADLKRVFRSRRFLRREATLEQIIETLRDTYCRSIGVEFMHIQEPVERQWLIDRMEPVRNKPEIPREKKLWILEKLMEGGLLEQFLTRNFMGQKRFSLEGGETLLPALETLVERGAELGASDMILGMAHRGRLTVLANIFRKPIENIFGEFNDNLTETVISDGDVKYHKGFSCDRELYGGRRIQLVMASNPSHLEAVNPVIEGMCRARQDCYGKDGIRRVLPVLLHGDAALPGQGVVSETFNLSQLEGYRTGGTVHLVLNNQIGFTTLPANARSFFYATDVAKSVGAPVFHVHGEDPEAAVFVTQLALDYRYAFHRDVVIEIICYRRHGHNEGDEPSITQPLMYDRIRNRPPVHEVYSEKLKGEGVQADEIDIRAKAITEKLERAYKAFPDRDLVGFYQQKEQFRRGYDPPDIDTGVAKEVLRELLGRLATIPEGFTPHPKIVNLLEKRKRAAEKGIEVDWGSGEALAFATLLAEGVSIRLSGEDSCRGTFGHRHSILYDRKTEQPYIPLSQTAAHGAVFHPWDSMLSEFAVLGFEYGYSVEALGNLVIWEAQFGDFANGAQVIIDQFIAGGESKWDRVSGLVLFLPHGYEGQGAEHSSARIERFLQLCADNNMQVVYPSTPAQLFHLLRRQVKQPFRKPLIVFTPKSLLRHPLCVSTLDDLGKGRFMEVMLSGTDPKKIQTLLLCTGKIFFDLLAQLQKKEQTNVAIVRIEQLYPLRMDILEETLVPYRNVNRVAWVQEEPENMGAWSFMRGRLSNLLGREPVYIGRRENDVPAVASHRMHVREQERIIDEALAVNGFIVANK
jgi:2-oxoglutarate dehydrogenase E1 component